MDYIRVRSRDIRSQSYGCDEGLMRDKLIHRERIVRSIIRMFDQRSGK